VIRREVINIINDYASNEIIKMWSGAVYVKNLNIKGDNL
jgi:hypothetical protein